MKLSKRAILVSVFVLTIVVSTVISILGVRTRKSKDDETKYSLIANSVYETIQNEFSKPIYTSLTMANDLFLIETLENEGSYTEKEAVDKMAGFLEKMKQATGAQTAFLISEESKRYYTYEGLNKIMDVENDEHDIWYTIFVNKRKPYDLDVDVDQVNGNSWTVFVNARIEDKKGKLLGVCGIGLAMENLQNILVQYENDYDLKVNFINSEGLVQVDTDAVNIENSYLYDVQYGKEKDGYSYKNNDGEYVVMRYIDSIDWYLVIHGLDGNLKVADLLPIILGSLCVIIVNLIVVFVVTRKP